MMMNDGGRRAPINSNRIGALTRDSLPVFNQTKALTCIPVISQKLIKAIITGHLYLKYILYIHNNILFPIPIIIMSDNVIRETNRHYNELLFPFLSETFLNIKALVKY